MTVYMVERELGGISLDNLAAAQKTAIAMAAGMRVDELLRVPLSSS